MKKAFHIYMIAVLILLFSCGQKATVGLKEDPAKAAKQFGLTLNEAVFCKSVENYKAIDATDKFTVDGGGNIKVYLLSGLRVESSGQTITHRFSKLVETLDGSDEVWQFTHELKMNVKPSKDFRTFSYVTALPGSYRADILATDGKTIIKSLFFTVEGEATSASPVDPEPSARVSLKDAQLCERVEKGTPVNVVSVFNPGPVYVWVETKADDFPTKIYYRWSREVTGLDGTTGWFVESYQSLDVKGKEWRTYAYRNCIEGKWRVDVLSSDAKLVLKSFEFKVGK